MQVQQPRTTLKVSFNSVYLIHFIDHFAAIPGTCDATNSVPANKRARFAQETTPGPPIPDPFLGKYGRLILFQSPFDTSDTLQTACAKCHIPVKEEAKTDGKEQ